jgi:hypothetical protein
VPQARCLHLCAPPPGPAGLYDRRLGSWPLPDRVRSTSRLPGPAGPGLHCHVTHALRGARAAPGGPAAPPAYWWSATPLAHGLYDRQLGPRPLPDRVRSTIRQPGPSGPGLRFHVTHAARRARSPPGGPLRRRRRTGVIVSAGEALGDASCVPARVVLVGPSERVGAGRGRVPLCRSRLAVCRAQHQLPMCNRPQAKHESPIPGVPCHELRKRDQFETKSCINAFSSTALKFMPLVAFFKAAVQLPPLRVQAHNLQGGPESL